MTNSRVQMLDWQLF